MVGRCWKMLLKPFLKSCNLVRYFPLFVSVGTSIDFPVHWAPFTEDYSCTQIWIGLDLIEAVATILYYFTFLKRIINPSLPLLPTRCTFQFCKAPLPVNSGTLKGLGWTVGIPKRAHEKCHPGSLLAGKRPHPRCIYPSNPRWMSKRMFILRA